MLTLRPAGPRSAVCAPHRDRASSRLNQHNRRGETVVLDHIAARVLGRALWRSSHLERIDRARSAFVKRTDLEEAWPLTVESVELCNGGPGAVFLIADGKHYPVNGLADGFLRGAGLQVTDLREIWRDDPTLPGLKVSVGPLIDMALAEGFGDEPDRFSLPWWRRRRASVVRGTLQPLLHVTKLVSKVGLALTASVRGRFGRMNSSVLVAGALFVTWLTTGILLQESWEALTGLWNRPFLEHGIFFAVAPGAMILVLVIFVMRHSDSD